MKTQLVVLIAGFLAVSTAPVYAHHAFAAEFDRDKPITVTGSVTKLEWTNPHIWVYVDVKDADGKIVNWAFQGGPPAYLTRVGWSKNDIKVGDVITITGSRSKDGSYAASGAKITLSDGRKVFTGTADQVGPDRSGEK
jgi:hypothetical protein